MIEPSGKGRRGLGRGLELLIGPVTPGEELVQLPVGSVRPNPRQPRKQFDPESIAELAESIRFRVSCSRSSCGPTRKAGTSSSPASGAGGRRSAGRACARSRLAGGRSRTSATLLLLALAENVAREDLLARSMRPGATPASWPTSWS